MNFKLDLNDKQIEGAFTAGFGKANERFQARAQEEITAVKWPWNRGESPRDIIDQGALRNSNEMREISPTEYEHSWNKNYAMAVHQGVRLRNGRTMPARGWTDEPVKQFEGDFEALTRVELNALK